MRDKMLKHENCLILIVDDNFNNLQALGTILMNNDYKIGTATSGRETLKFVDERPPDLILLDVMMPKMDGFEVCERLKSKDSTRDIPIIIITALSDTSDKLEAFHAGAVDYVTKPFVKEEVLARIEVHLELKMARERLAKLSVTDALTQSFNRRFALLILPKLLKNADREDESLSICFIDIDGLKKVNDTYGHSHGDKLIRNITDAIHESIRGSDYLCRMGGDEFLIIFPDLQLEDSHMIIERVLKKLDHNGDNLNAGFSYGFAEYRPGDGTSHEELIKKADENMYVMKVERKGK